MWYRGGIGQWSWLFHRLTGVGVVLFLLLHIADTALVMLGPAHYNTITAIYRLPVFRFMEVGLFACLLFHALNGVRIILMDFRLELMRLHELLFKVQMVCFALLFIPAAWIMLKPLLVR